MNSESPNHSDNQEIDLAQVSKKIKGFFERILTNIFGLIFFIKKNKLIVGFLVLFGFLIGLYLEKSAKKYEHEIMVKPNFGSVDYLYSKINLIDSKIKEGDTLFLKNILGIHKPKELTGIKVEPVIDIYQFIQETPNNFELIKLMAEDGDIKKIVKENITSKNYKFHLISFSTLKKMKQEDIIAPILKFLNESEYYKKMKEIQINNLKRRIIENDSLVAQINGILNTFSTKDNSKKQASLVYFNENTQLNDIIQTKQKLIDEQGYNRTEVVNYQEIIKRRDATLNMEKTTAFNSLLKILLPFVFIGIFLFIKMFVKQYNKQKAKLMG